MTTVTVTVLDDERLIREGEAAAIDYAKATSKARANILPMARGLIAARRKFSNIEFGQWFDRSPYAAVVTNHTMRAALIKLGEHEAVAAAFLRTTHLTSPESIWDAVKSIVDAASSEPLKTESVQESPADSSQPASQEPEKSESAEPETPISTPTSRVSTHRSPFLALKLPKSEVELVHQHILDSDTRSMLAKLIAKKSNRPIWGLVIESICSGAFGPPSKANITVGNLRLLFPWLASRDSFGQQDLTKPYTQKFVRTYVIPLLIEDRSLMQTDGSQLNRLAINRRADDENKERERLRMEQHEDAAQKLPTTEQPIIAYGTPLWPPIGDLKSQYTYSELCHAVWYWRYFLSIAQREWSPKATGMAVRHLTKYIGPLQPGFVQAVREISSAHEQRPDGESKFPMTPVNFGL